MGALRKNQRALMWRTKKEGFLEEGAVKVYPRPG